MHITTKEIAERCGVTRITVDRALNGRPGISEKRRAEIIKIAKEMGYRPHRLAQALVNGRSKSLGIVVFDLYNSFFAQMVDEFQRAAFEAGFVTYVMLSNKDEQLERDCIEHLLDRRVDAIALDSVISAADYAPYIQQLPVPVLSLMNELSGGIPLLTFDDHRAMYDMTLYVLSKGYRRLIYVCPPLCRAHTSNMETLVRRKQGFDQATRDFRERPKITVLGDGEYLKALSEISFSGAPRTAILCTSDIYAISIQKQMSRRGLRAPFDYGLSGFDNIPLLHAFDPQITTVSLDIGSLGRRGAELLIGALNGQPLPLQTIMPYEILPGQTILDGPVRS